MLIIDPTQIVELDVVIHAMSASGACYATPYKAPVEKDGQVFIPQGVAKRFGLCPGDSVKLRAVPNSPELSDRVRWRSIYIFPRDTDPAPTPAAFTPRPRFPSDDEIKAKVEDEACDGRVWTMRTMFEQIIERMIDYKNDEDKRVASLIGGHLRKLHKDGRLYMLELYAKSESAHAVYFCSDMAELVPDGYK